MPDSLILRAVIGVALAAAIAWAARRARLLDARGGVAAIVVGTSCSIGGLTWIAGILVFFATSSALTHWRAREKQAAVGAVVEKGGTRDALQVVANGGVFAVAAVLAAMTHAAVWQAAGAGALAAATADTWSTEIGTAWGGPPRHLLRWSVVPTGASGGVTTIGSLAALAGALFMALVMRALGWTVPIAAVVAGGVAGSLADSLLGATLQERRHCDACGRFTERRVHDCGSVTRIRGGIPGFGNDAVNVVSVLAGAAISALFS